MSRIGKRFIEVPEKVTIKLDGQKISVDGPKGNLSRILPSLICWTLDDSKQKIFLEKAQDTKLSQALFGLSRTLVANMVIGVSEGWTKELELVGVGYRATAQGQKLELALGFSHSVVMSLAQEVKVETVSEKGANPIIKLTSYDKQLVGQVAAKIRSFRKPEPYKGKGIRFVGEQIRRKAGKQA